MADEKQKPSAPEDELDQIIQDMAAEEDAAPAPTLSLAKKTPDMEPVTKKADQSLSLELSGVVNLRLTFASGERSMELVCTEDALVCRMADGTEFRIPTSTGIDKKRNAA